MTTTITPTADPTPTIDEAKAERFVHQVIGDLGAAMSAVLVHIGDRLGLYRALGDGIPVTSIELAAKTGLNERYVREWLANQTAGGYVVYDPIDNTYELPAEQAMVLAHEDSPAFLAGAFDTTHGVSLNCQEVLLSTMPHVAMRAPFGVPMQTFWPTS